MKALVLFLILLVGGNFVLDWWRRFDFLGEKQEAGALLGTLKVEADADRAEARLLFETLRLQNKALEASVGALTQSLESMRSLYTAVSRTGADVSASAGAPEETLDLDTPVPFSKVPELPADAILERIHALRNPGNERLSEKYTQFADHKAWESQQIIAMFEEEKGLTLDRKSKELLSCEIEAYKQAAIVAFGKYQMEKSLHLADRIEEGDYEVANESGQFDGPEPPEDELFSVALMGNKRIRWLRSDYPELYRLNMVSMYMPLAMIQAVDRSFAERMPK